MSSLGKWSVPGVPHKGWVCVDLFDAGSDGMITCQMCEWAEVRYIHVLTNERWPYPLMVGCHCAERMEEDAGAAKLRENDLKKQISDPEKWQERENALSWVEGANEIFEATEGGIGMQDREVEFVSKVRWQMDRYANPRVKKKWSLSDKQRGWFAAIYRKYVMKGRKVA